METKALCSCPGGSPTSSVEALRMFPLWDLNALANAGFFPDPPTVFSGWSAFGVQDLTDGLMVKRADLFLKTALAKLAG